MDSQLNALTTITQTLIGTWRNTIFILITPFSVGGLYLLIWIKLLSQTHIDFRNTTSQDLRAALSHQFQ